MTLDIRHILDDWPYEHGHISARKIRGDDGRDKIQLRLDLGLLQMECTGRPDGVRPHGCESLLQYYEDAIDRRGETGGAMQFDLDERACELLRNEAVMYYHRYLAEFVLEEYAAVVRDTTRNLRVMELCSEYAREESDRFALEQYRPYVVMMRTRAAALEALGDNRSKAALDAVRRGHAEIEAFYRRFAPEEEDLDQSAELAVLRALARDIEARIPPDPVKKIKHRLERAVREERYEEAALLRDQLRHLTGNELAGGGF